MIQYEWINYKGYRLRAPAGFDPDEIIGGCGPGEWGDRLVPDSILGVDIGPSCDIHDYAYLIGETEEERTQADIEMFANSFRIIKQESNQFMLLPRTVIIGIYFMACVYGGEKSFKGE